MRLPLSVLAWAVVLATSAHAEPSDRNDPYLWLEDVHGERATSWVDAENAKTLNVLEKDPHYAALHAAALGIAEAKDRIPAPRIIGGEIYNFWQDADHVRGIWRRTSVADYRAAEPHWQTVLDLDALAAREKANWFNKGEDCERTRQRRCLVSLSDGGEDATTVREFDLPTQSFVADGFTLPRSKQGEGTLEVGDVAWENPDTILAAREWQPGELTAAGYPYVVRRLARGQPLSAAVEVFRGEPTDGGYGVAPATLVDADGRSVTLISRPLSTFEAETYLLTGEKAVRLPLPLKSGILGLVAGRLVVSIRQDWTAAGTTFGQGSVLSFDLAALKADPADPRPTLVYAPGPHEAFDQAVTTRDRLVVTILDNVKGKAFVYAPGASGWSSTRLELPDASTLNLVDADIHSDAAFVSVESFLTPSTLDEVDTHTMQTDVVKSLPARFDAARDQVDQLEATSTDGTRVPYFVVHPRAMTLDGANPTILYAYGGFQVSMTPSYSANVGKLWLERGGVFVLANIRGGGEFGPAWHEAGLKTRRQVIYDDFASVAKDLIDRGVTSPRRLGMEGGSNGGLLMGVEFTQHPELWNAVDIQVPLLDMLRFEVIAAGTSWTGEYGSVSVPEERAFLERISPYNNLRPGVAYPEPLIWTTTKDDRVGPQHARKFAARLGGMGIPYLFYEVTEGGHGSGANLEEKARTTALEMTYFTRKLMD
ncbi:MAG: prolyl oligopeptidase family serine peptidase [Janthinobacterium lividum]